MIYFDNAATSFYKPTEVKLAIENSINRYTANPGRSGHKLSIETAQKVFETRENIKKFFNADDYDVIFTKNCTEALNLAIFGSLNTGDHVIVTCYEHNSVLRPLEKLKSMGVEVSILDCDLYDVSKLIENEIKSNTKLIITTFVSNVTGEICDVKQVAKIAKQYGIRYLIDGAQACGHMKINLNDIGADMMVFAGHKGLLAITGVGGLIIKKGTKLNPLIFGGTGTSSESLVQPTITAEDFEAGTLPTIAIISLNAGINFLNKHFEKIFKREQKLSEYLYFELKKLNFLNIFSKNTSQNVFSFNLLDYDSSAVANILNEKYGICVRSGLHCAPLIHKKLGTLNRGAVRVSIDFNNTVQEVDYLIYALKEINSL